MGEVDLLCGLIPHFKKLNGSERDRFIVYLQAIDLAITTRKEKRKALIQKMFRENIDTYYLEAYGDHQ